MLETVCISTPQTAHLLKSSYFACYLRAKGPSVSSLLSGAPWTISAYIKTPGTYYGRGLSLDDYASIGIAFDSQTGNGSK